MINRKQYMLPLFNRVTIFAQSVRTLSHLLLDACRDTAS